MKKSILAAAAFFLVASAHALTANRVIKASGATTITDSQIQDNGTGVAVGTSPVVGVKLAVNGSIQGTELVGPMVSTGNFTASGTPSASTYLRGDNTWATPSGGGGGWTFQAYSGPAVVRTSGTPATAATLTVPAASLSTNGDSIIITASGWAAPFTTGFDLQAGGQSIATAGLQVERFYYTYSCSLTRSGSNAQDFACLVQAANAAGTVHTITPTNGTLTLTDSNPIAITVVLTGDGSTGSSAASALTIGNP